MMTDPRPAEGPDREALACCGMCDDDCDCESVESCLRDWRQRAEKAEHALSLLPTSPAPGCPSGRCEHRADAHTTHPAGLCLIRGCPCPTPPAPGGTSEPPPDTSWTKTARVRESGIDGPIHRFLTGRHHDKPTPPAPGDQPCAECGVEENRHGTVDGCSGFRPLPAPGDGEGLRAEREHFVRAAAVNVGQDIMAADVRFLFDRLDEARAALAARDTDQGAGEALAEVERLVAKPWALRDQRGQTVMAVPIHDLRTALARATPEAGEHNPDECAKHRGCYQ
jgi:hypothetical protein